MPDYNPAVALGLHPPENSLAQTFNTIANLQQSQAHTGLYTLQAAQQQRDLDAKRAYADTIRGGGSLHDAAMAAVSRGGNTSDVNQLLAASSLENELKVGGGLRASAIQEFSGAAKNRAETSNLGVQHGILQTEQAKKDMEYRGSTAQSLFADPSDENWNANVPNLRGHVSPQGWAQIQAAMKDPSQRPRVAQSMIAAAMPTAEATGVHPTTGAQGMTTPLGELARNIPQPAGGAAPPPGRAPMTPGAVKQQEGFAEEGVKHYKESQESSKNAATAQYGLGELENNLNALPAGSDFLTPGSGFGKRLAFAKSVNTTLGGLGAPLLFDPTKIAAGEAAQKGTTRLGFDTAKILGSRESQMIVQQAVGIQPGGQMTPAANARIIPALTAAAQREKDYFKFLNTYTKDNPNALPGEAQIQFNEQHPPSQYVADVSKLTAIKQGYGGAIKDLRADPKLAKDFDQHFGVGMSRYFLGN